MKHLQTEKWCFAFVHMYEKKIQIKLFIVKWMVAVTYKWKGRTTFNKNCVLNNICRKKTDK